MNQLDIIGQNCQKILTLIGEHEKAEEKKKNLKEYASADHPFDRLKDEATNEAFREEVYISVLEGRIKNLIRENDELIQKS